MCKIIISSEIFFHFFKIFIFWIVRGVKVQKIVQNDNKLCPSHSISQEPYITWLSFMVHLCKMIISPAGFFSFFQNFDSPGVFLILKFWFSGLSGGWKGKKLPKMTKISVCRTLHFGNYISYDLHLWCTCIYRRIISPSIF